MGQEDPTPETSLESLVKGILAEETPRNVSASAPTMGRLAKLNYSHEAMIDLIIAKPGISQKELAIAFGYTPSWICNALASDIFQMQLDKRRKEVIDPTLIATIEERLRGMLIQGINVVQEKLAEPNVKPEVALRAIELGAKGLGIGGNAPPKFVPVDLGALADRLTALNGARVIQGEATVVSG
jgi:hypothetical protein